MAGQSQGRALTPLGKSQCLKERALTPKGRREFAQRLKQLTLAPAAVVVAEVPVTAADDDSGGVYVVTGSPPLSTKSRHFRANSPQFVKRSFVLALGEGRGPDGINADAHVVSSSAGRSPKSTKSCLEQHESPSHLVRRSQTQTPEQPCKIKNTFTRACA
jgi:hypothetical protein